MTNTIPDSQLLDLLEKAEKLENLLAIFEDAIIDAPDNYGHSKELIREHFSTLVDEIVELRKDKIRAQTLDTYRHTVEGLLDHAAWCATGDGPGRECDCTRAGLLNDLYPVALQAGGKGT